MTPDLLIGKSRHACVAPSWPEWATTEDCDIVWVRLDLAHRAEEIAAPALDMDVPRAVLRNPRNEHMWLDLQSTEWSDEWMLRRAHLDDDPHDVATYVSFDVEEGDWPEDDE